MERVARVNLGLCEYQSAWKIQRQLVDRKIQNRKIEDYLLFVEHPHVFTIGRRGNQDNILSPDFPVYRVERGGDVTYHGPGQLVLYPIFDLERKQISLKDYIFGLERAIIHSLRDFGIEANQKQGYTGVWVNGTKIASIGVAVDHFVTYHGAALNVNTDLSNFFKIRPCGLPPELMTSMQKLTGRPQSLDQVGLSLSRSIEEVFGISVYEEPLEAIGVAK